MENLSRHNLLKQSQSNNFCDDECDLENFCPNKGNILKNSINLKSRQNRDSIINMEESEYLYSNRLFKDLKSEINSSTNFVNDVQLETDCDQNQSDIPLKYLKKTSPYCMHMEESMSDNNNQKCIQKSTLFCKDDDNSNFILDSTSSNFDESSEELIDAVREKVRNTEYTEFLRNLHLNKEAIEQIQNEEDRLSIKEDSKNIPMSSFYKLYHTNDVFRQNVVVNCQEKQKIDELNFEYEKRKRFYVDSLLDKVKESEVFERIMESKREKSYLEKLQTDLDKSIFEMEKAERQLKSNEIKLNQFTKILVWWKEKSKLQLNNAENSNEKKKCISRKTSSLKEINLKEALDSLTNEVDYFLNHPLNLTKQDLKNTEILPKDYDKRKSFYESSLIKKTKECEKVLKLLMNPQNSFASFFNSEIDECRRKIDYERESFIKHKSNADRFRKLINSYRT